MIIQLNGQTLNIRQVGILGWAGRDKAAVQAHIDELAAIGVKPPSTFPLVYRVSPHTVIQNDSVSFIGTQHSGEAEVCLIADENQKLWVSVGSDHTDRGLEAHDVALSKQLCAKPLAYEAWALDDVINHWDTLELLSYITTSEKKAEDLYQKGTIDSLLPIEGILAAIPEDLLLNGQLQPETLLFCGTLSAIGGIKCQATAFSMTLRDSLRGKEISHRYEISSLPQNN